MSFGHNCLTFRRALLPEGCDFEGLRSYGVLKLRVKVKDYRNNGGIQESVYYLMNFTS
jgi:hypothetical protein